MYHPVVNITLITQIDHCACKRSGVSLGQSHCAGCSWARHFTLTKTLSLNLLTQVNVKWVLNQQI